MIRVAKITDYGVRLLATLAESGKLVSATILAEDTGIPEPTVRKVMKHLAHQGLVRSERGARGGYHLALNPEELDLATMVEAFEGPIAVTECCDLDVHCEHEKACVTIDIWRSVNEAVRSALSQTTLAQMIQARDLVQLSAPHHQHSDRTAGNSDQTRNDDAPTIRQEPPTTGEEQAAFVNRASGSVADENDHVE